MKMRIARLVATLPAWILLAMLTVEPAAAVHETVDCSASTELSPLLLLVHNLTQILYVLGGAVGVALLGYAGIVFMYGSEDSRRRAKERVKRVLVGVVILLSSPLVVGFLVSQLPVCGGA